MRFLLHPTRSAAVSRKAAERFAKTNLAGGVTVTAIKNSTTFNTSTPSGDTQQQDDVIKRAWGQQCSPSCGCVVRFEAVLDESQTILAASYHAKKIVTQRTKKTRDNDTLQAVLTQKGRPMLKKCTCSSLNHLSNAVIQYLDNKNLQSVKSELNFWSLRSSVAFRQTVLSVQQLPSRDTQCFDVVEEALTALIKGYLPQPRQQQQQATSITTTLEGDDADYATDDRAPSTSFLPTSSPSTRPFFFDDLYWNYFHNNESPEQTAADDPVHAMSSTLNLFDRAQQEEEEEQQNMLGKLRRRRSSTTPMFVTPSDWVSYVDTLYQAEEKQQEESA